jgi:hypothetical protein
VQGSFGKGWVVLTSVHAEAPENWPRGLAFTTPVARTHAYAARLLDAALRRTLLPRHCRATDESPIAAMPDLA